MNNIHKIRLHEWIIIIILFLFILNILTDIFPILCKGLDNVCMCEDFSNGEDNRGAKFTLVKILSPGVENVIDIYESQTKPLNEHQCTTSANQCQNICATKTGCDENGKNCTITPQPCTIHKIRFPEGQNADDYIIHLWVKGGPWVKVEYPYDNSVCNNVNGRCELSVDNMGSRSNKYKQTDENNNSYLVVQGIQINKN